MAQSSWSDEEMRWQRLVRWSAETLDASAKVFDVPRSLYDTKPEAYAPQHIALGPYHHSRPDLKDMLRYKFAAAKRAEGLFTGNRKIPDLVNHFLKLQGEIRGPYHRILELSNETLAWMMAIDTCFLLAFLLRCYQPEEATDTAVSSATNWINAIVSDVMMLENQLPLVLLTRNLEFDPADMLLAALDRFIRDVCPIKTYANTALPDVTKQAHLLELLYHFLVPTTAVFEDNSGGGGGGGGSQQDDPPPAQQHNQADVIGDLENQLPENLISHPKNLAGQVMRKMLCGLLHVVGKMRAPVDVKALLKDVNMGTNIIDSPLLKDVNMGTNIIDSPLEQEIKIPSAAQLAECGVRFVPAPEGIAGVAFDEKTATLSLPIIVLDSNTEVVLRNLVAYESVAVRGPRVLARYMELMNGILDTAKDVKMLQQSSVVMNYMKSNAEAASMWNGMCRGTRVSRVPRLEAVVRAVNAHRDRTAVQRDRTASARAQKLLEKYSVFMSKYYVFMSWKILTLIASVLLLLMTALQTFCSTYPCQSTWYRH